MPVLNVASGSDSIICAVSFWLEVVDVGDRFVILVVMCFWSSCGVFLSSVWKVKACS